jgi:hypothetical protein
VPQFPPGLGLPASDASLYPKRPLWSDLGGSTRELPHVDRDPLWRTLNPSVALSPTGELAIALRTSNYYLDPSTGEYFVFGGGPIRSRTYVAGLTDELELTETALVDWDPAGPDIRRGVEDCRLFWRDGQWRLLGVLVEDHSPVARQIEYSVELGSGNATWTTTHASPTGVEEKRPQKNWMCPYDATDQFDFVYGPTEVLRHGELLSRRDDVPGDAMLRGGSLLWRLDDGSYLALVHRTASMRLTPRYSALSYVTIFPMLRDYRHLLARYDASGRLVALSPEFSFLEPGVEFGSGLVVRGKDLVLSFGSWDASAHLATVPLETALEWLQPV